MRGKQRDEEGKRLKNVNLREKQRYERGKKVKVREKHKWGKR